MTDSLAGTRPILQVHPTRRCNLQCAHCYTSSGPTATAGVDPSLLVDAIADAGRLGYRQLAISGGEPFLSPALESLLAAGRLAGMATTVTTNGTVLRPERLAGIRDDLDFVAVSVDGPPEDHNLIRRNPHAFSRMLAGLDILRRTRIAFGVIFTLTRYNADQLDWLASFAAREGASLVQVHPLDRQGRAASQLHGAEPDGLELLAAMAEIDRLRITHSTLRFHLDAATKDQLRAHRDVFVPPATAALPRLAPTLVIDDQGVVTPLTMGVDPTLQLGSLTDHPLRDLERDWRHDRAGAFAALLADAYERAVTSDAEPATYWYSTLAGIAGMTSR